MKILIVEDDGVLALSTMHHLVEMGHEVTGIAKSGDTAFKRITERPPELVLMDIKLYGPMSGIEITKVINEKYAIPVIYVTAHTDDETMRQINETRHFGVISKPFEPHELKVAIDTWLNKE